MLLQALVFIAEMLERAAFGLLLGPSESIDYEPTTGTRPLPRR